jgi:type II secretory pathway pseudopilin PulG
MQRGAEAGRGGMPTHAARACHRRIPGAALGGGKGLEPYVFRAPDPLAPARPTRRAAFTLIEILLALFILVLLIAATAMNLGPWQGTGVLEEGAGRVETALRMARADAANKARRVRIAFGEEDGKFQVLWEAEPLAEPGKFAEYTACAWRDLVPMDGVRVERCELTAPSIYQIADAGTPGGGTQQSRSAPALAAITFEPDGSGDSAVIELSATDGRDTRRAIIEIQGLTGTISSRILTTGELEAEQQAQR